MNKPELISFSDHLMIAPFYDQRQFFAPEIEQMKGGFDGLMQSGLIKESKSRLIEINGNTAILRIEGPLRPGRGWYFSVGYGDIQDAIVELIDSSVTTVIQVLRTPGGTVAQAFETQEMFQELAKEKRLISLIEMATSAGALMTFPAHERYLASKTAQTGSIGVVAEHVDNRIWYKEYWGEIRTSVAKGDLKDAGTDVRPYDAKAKQVFEESVAKLYDVFADEAVKGLNLTREQVDAQQSAVFIGADGIQQGFADGFAALEQLIEQSNTVSTTPGRPAFSNPLQEIKTMDLNQLKAEHQGVYQAAVDEGKALGFEASKETHTNEGRAAGILEERKRVNEIDALGLPAEFAAKARSEDWAAEKAAAEYLKAQKETRSNVAEDIENSLEQAISTDAPEMPINPENEEPKVVNGKSSEEEMKSVWDKSEDLQSEYGGDFDRYKSFLRAETAGRAKIFNVGGK